ncbi:MAG: DUF4405 domain-containing protein [Chlorobiaceae bacterium]|nr:DUF4405 domain-containing protein [Chlorobiaceae bacterium]
MKAVVKTLATPLVSGAFVISAVTGLLLFFDFEIGLVEPAHKWLSWLLLSGILLHLVLHWKQFTGYLSSKPATAVIGTGVLVALLSVYPGFGEKENEGGKEQLGKLSAYALSSSSLETLALVMKNSPENLVAELGKTGIIVKDPASTIQEIAKQNGKNDKELLVALLGNADGTGKAEGDRD